MEDALAVGEVDGPRQRLHRLGGGAGRLRLAGRLLGQVAALDELQRQERQTVVFADLMNLDDVGVTEGGDGLGLGLEAGAGRGARPAARQDHLERDESIQARLPRLVHDAHAAAADLPQDLVARQAGQQDGRRGLGRQRGFDL